MRQKQERRSYSLGARWGCCRKGTPGLTPGKEVESRARAIRLLGILTLLCVVFPGAVLAQKSTANGQRVPVGEAIGLQQITSGLTAPVALAEAPDGTGRLFIVDQIGLIWIWQPDGTLLEQPFLDLRHRLVELKPHYDERGLLGLAFHRDFDQNGRFFVYYSAPLREEAPDNWNHTSHLSEFRVSTENPNQANPDSERLLLLVDQPQSNHNAGTLAFGPDKYLYVSLGDGGGADDQGERGGPLIGHVDDWYEENGGGNGQDIEQNLLGSILRIDVDGADPYGIPCRTRSSGDTSCVSKLTYKTLKV